MKVEGGGLGVGVETFRVRASLVEANIPPGFDKIPQGFGLHELELISRPDTVRDSFQSFGPEP